MKSLRVITRPVYKVYKATPHIEKVGFVMIAGAHILHLDTLFIAIEILLLISGAGAVALETFHIGKEE